MKNYYEILEVSTNASPEVIEKAYKALAKKYHPDVQEPNKVKWAEENFKEISAAYEILSNEESKSQYDLEFEQSSFNQNINDDINSENINNNYEDLLSHTEKLEKEIYDLKSQQNEENSIDETEINNAINNAIDKAYNDAYIKRLKDYGYKIKYKKSFKTNFKNFIRLLITLILIFVIFYIIWQIPSVKSYFIDFYNNNDFIQFFIKPFIK